MNEVPPTIPTKVSNSSLTRLWAAIRNEAATAPIRTSISLGGIAVYLIGTLFGWVSNSPAGLMLTLVLILGNVTTVVAGALLVRSLKLSRYPSFLAFLLVLICCLMPIAAYTLTPVFREIPFADYQVSLPLHKPLAFLVRVTYGLALFVSYATLLIYAMCGGLAAITTSELIDAQLSMINIVDRIARAAESSQADSQVQTAISSTDLGASERT